jgi:hypothetical protein
MGGWGRLALLAVSLAASGCAYRAQTRATGWLVVDTEHVRLRTTLSPRRAMRIARELQEIRDGLSGLVLRCGSSGKDDRIRVTVLPSSAFGDIAPERSDGVYREWTVPWLPDYEGQIIVPDNLGYNARQVYQHELTHRLVASCLRRPPLWLNEGLASMIETAVVEGETVTIGIPAYMIVKERQLPFARRYRGVRVVVVSRDSLPPIRRVVSLTPGAFHSSGSLGSMVTEGNYATAWALVHLLDLGADDLRARFLGFLEALRSGETDPEVLFAAYFGDARLQDRLNDYLSRGKFPSRRFRIPPPRYADLRARHMTAGEAHAHWAWMWLTSARNGESRERMREHLDAAKADPAARAGAHVLAAAFSRFAGDVSGAEREVNEGLRVAPDDPGLLHARVDLLLARGADASAAAAQLGAVARTAEQLCAVARADLVGGHPGRALAFAARGRAMKPNSTLCRRCVDVATKAIARAAPGDSEDDVSRARR